MWGGAATALLGPSGSVEVHPRAVGTGIDARVIAAASLRIPMGCCCGRPLDVL